MKLSKAQLANYERANAWRGRAAKAQRQAARSPLSRVAQSLSFNEDGYSLQLPLYVLPLNDNGTQWTRGDNGDPAEHQRLTVWKALTSALRSIDRETIVAIEFHRLSTSAVGLDDHDNLGSAFKYLCDAVCAWIFEGDRVFGINPRGLGKYDGMFTRTGGTICHSQQQWSAHGVVVRFRLGESRSPTPAPYAR